ncbi:MAG: DUF4314 domain-containing protein [Planctomycetes bacterium]|nr:DUF4314 domain-containing protein [Planctomycetota bacterium]
MAAPLNPGTRIRLVSMMDDPDPIPTGATGTVRGFHEHRFGRDLWQQIEVDWDNGRQLMLVTPPDVFEVLRTPESKEKK